MSADDATAAQVEVADIDAAIAGRDMDRAIALAQQAHAQGAREPLVMNLVAYQLELEDRLVEALAVLNEALRLSPGDPFVINSIGVCYSKLNKPENAIAAFDDALVIAPDFAHAHNGRGLALAALGDHDGARLAQRRAMELDPQFPEPVGALAALAAEDEDWDEARAYAEKALALEPDQPAANMAMAVIEIAERRFAEAEARMARLIAGGRLTQLHRGSALYYRAQALEGLDRPEEAMRTFQEANACWRPLYIAGLNGRELGLITAQRLREYFKTADPARWTAIPEPGNVGGEAGHVFLVGFARSGTTLLEQILASHPDMVAMEEKPAIDPAIFEFLYSEKDIDRLAALDDAGARHWREVYWKRVRDFGVDPTGKVFVDKLPLHILYLPVIAKLFPRAKILFARRDPRDVVVSCFRHRFKGNPLTSEFTDLERTAQVYATAMQLGELYQEKLPLPFHIHRHEDLVEDLDGQTRAICEFIGLPWHENMRNFVDTANKREIRTPSAGQVRRGLYRDGFGQWRKYGETIDVIHPIVKPWVKAFGYPPK